MKALAARPELQVERVWRPFQLRPEMPLEGVPWAEYAAAKFGGPQRLQQIQERMRTVGAEDGIVFDYDKIIVSANTRDAHRLILFAADQGQEWAMADRLYRAYFSEGRNIGDSDELVALATEVGLDPAAVRTYLASDILIDAIAEAQEAAWERGVQGVPLYVFNGRYALSGAQPVEVFHEVFDVVQERFAEDRADD